MHSSSNLISEAYFALCKETDTPVSLGLWLRFKYSQSEFLKFDLDPKWYTECDTQRFKRDYMCSSYLSKWKGLDTKVDLEAVALSKFATSEAQCRQTNIDLRGQRSLPTNGKLSSLLHAMKGKIARLLGPFSLFAVEPHFEWGPGATHDIPRARAQVDHKIATVPITVGGSAKQLLQSVIQYDLHWAYTLLGVFPSGPWSFLPHVFETVNTCRVETVPKNAKTNRVIAIEPTGNLFLQKGVGGHIRKRLRNVGVDLNDQKVNQNFARKALSRSLATLDLKAASDSVSRELVYELLPLDWVLFLESIRSPLALMPDGTSVRLEKFSSMGNGFTFELESMIFWALLASIVEPGEVLSVYGDDLICPEAASREVVEALNSIGFLVNEEKSFVDGLFFESCGQHYFNGTEVTPAYQKETLEDCREFFRSHNRLRRWSDRVSLETRAHLPIYRAVPDRLNRCLIPHGCEGDDGFLVPIEVLWDLNVSQSANLGFRCRVVKEPLNSFPGIESALLANALRRGCKNQPDGGTPSEPWRSSFPDTFLPAKRASDNGNVELSVYGRDPVTEASDLVIGHRWIIPPGYSPLPQM